ncbi:hypothetical protein IWZ01DRAFT_107009 [Phyllosticta capitalensis]
MPLFQIQGKVNPLPNVDLSGKTAIVTGANGGIGFECARQLLQFKANVILAVRNLEKGEDAKRRLQDDNSRIKVMKLDLADYTSVSDFVSQVQTEVQDLHILILNAAIGNVNLQWAPSGHELLLQVNFLSNVLLLLQLLPLLESTAEKSGPSRVTWVGSRALFLSRFRWYPVKTNVIEYLDKNFYSYQRYADTKAIAYMFLRELSSRIKPNRVILNMVCPGLVHSKIVDTLPFYYRYPMVLLKAITARPTDQGAWIVVYMVAVAGAESHGKFYENQVEQKPAFMDSVDGLEMQRLVWKDTWSEVSKYAELPSSLVEG